MDGKNNGGGGAVKQKRALLSFTDIFNLFPGDSAI